MIRKSKLTFLIAPVALIFAIAASAWILFPRVKQSRSKADSPAGDVANSPSASRVQEPELNLAILNWHFVDELPESLAQFETVFWEPADTISLRKWIATDGNMQGKRVLEIGSGTGLLALCCLVHGAQSVTAIDVNPAAVANTLYNAERLKVADRLTVLQSQADRSPFDEIDKAAKFDLIISNPPWEDGTIETVDQFALYDPGLRLCDRLLGESQSWMNPGSKLFLVYGAKTAIKHILELAPQRQWEARIVDDRDLGTLSEVFLPGMLLELIPKTERGLP